MTSASILPSGGKRDVVQLTAWSPFAGHLLKDFAHDPLFVGSPATGAKKLSDMSEETDSRKPMDNDAGAVCIVERQTERKFVFKVEDHTSMGHHSLQPLHSSIECFDPRENWTWFGQQLVRVRSITPSRRRTFSLEV